MKMYPVGTANALMSSESTTWTGLVSQWRSSRRMPPEPPPSFNSGRNIPDGRGLSSNPLQEEKAWRIRKR